MSKGAFVLALRVPLVIVALTISGACHEPNAPAVATIVHLTIRADSLWIGDTIRVAAAVRAADGTALDRPISWRSSDGRIATVGADGLVSTLAKGRVWVVASVEGVRDSVELRSLARVATLLIVPPQPIVSVGRLLVLRVRLLDADHDTIEGRPVIWASSQPTTLALVNARDGEFGALAPGAAHLVALAEGIRDSVAVTVLPRIATVSLAWDADTVAPGDTIALTAVARDAHGNTLDGLPVTFRIDGDTLPFTLSGGNRAVARAAGRTDVHVEVDSVVRLDGTIWSGVRFTQFSVGHLFSCGFDATLARLLCLGTNAWGTVGNGSTDSYASVPVPVTGVPVVSVSKATLDHICGLTAGGRVGCWGDNFHGQLGVPASAVGRCRTSDGTHACSRVAVGDPALPAFQSVSAGWDHTCAVTIEGQAWCWGYDFGGRLGRGADAGTGSAPAPVAGGIVFRLVEAGWGYTCALSPLGAAYCWGGGGMLGTGDDTTRSSPTPVVGALQFTTLSVGLRRSCGLTAAGAAWCWGETAAGTRLSPVLVTPAPAFVAISAGVDGTCALTAAGEMYCWDTEPIRVGGSRRFDTVSVGWGNCGRDVSNERVYCGMSATSAGSVVAGQR